MGHRVVTNAVPLLTGQFKAILAEVGLATFAVALNNACCHGEVFTEGGWDFSDETLEKLFDHIEGLREVARKMS